MTLNSKQRKHLRGLANTLNPVLIVGKENVSAAVVEEAEKVLEAQELVKCRVLEASALTAREAADELVRACRAECVQVIGRCFVLYRWSHRDGIKHVPIE